MHARIGAALSDDGNKVGIDTDGRRQRVLRVVLRQRIDLVHKTGHGSDRIIVVKGGHVHDGETLLQDIGGNDVLEIGGDDFKAPVNLLFVRGIPVFLAQSIHNGIE